MRQARHPRKGLRLTGPPWFEAFHLERKAAARGVLKSNGSMSDCEFII